MPKAHLAVDTATRNWYHTVDLNREYYTCFSGYKSEWVTLGKSASPQDICDFMNSRGDGKYRSVMLEFEDSVIFSCKTHEPVKTGGLLDPGVYRYEEPDYNIELPERLEVIDIREDDYLELDGPFLELDTEIKKFIENEELFKKKGFIHKRGILLYGPPGNGKTVFIRRVIEELVPDEAVVIMIRDGLPEHAFLDKLRNSLKDRLKVFIFEELAVTARREQDAEGLLNFLDGCDSMDNSLILATTNYPEKLPGNIVDRPSRIDTVIEIPNPNQKTICQLVKYFLDRDITKEELKETDDLSIAAIKEACLLTIMKDMTLSKAIKANKDRSKLVRSAFAKPTTVGFGFN